MKNKNSAESVIIAVFTLVGGIFVVLSIVMAIKFQFDKGHMDETDAVISHIGNETTLVDYYYDGEEYEGVNLGEYASNMYVGKVIRIYVDRDDPYRIMGQMAMKILPIIFGGMGLIFVTIGFGFMIPKYRIKKLKSRLKAEGRIINATVERIDFNTMYTVNGQNPYLVFADYRDEITGDIINFKSENLWYDVNEYINIGDQVKVYVDRNNPKKYYMDVQSSFSVIGSMEEA